MVKKNENLYIKCLELAIEWAKERDLTIMDITSVCDIADYFYKRACM